MRRSRKSRPTWRPFWIEPSQCGRGLSGASEVVFGICVNTPFLVVFVPYRFSFVFFAPDSCIIWPDVTVVKGARSSARSLERSGNPLRRAQPTLSKIIRGEENWATLRRPCECGPATASFLIHRAFRRSSLLSLLKLNGRIHAACLLSAL